MSVVSDRMLADIVAQTVSDRPLPASIDDLDASSRRYLEQQARHARMTPEALWALSRNRDRLSHDERLRATARDARNLSDGRAMDQDTTSAPASVDDVVAALTGGAR